MKFRRALRLALETVSNTAEHWHDVRSLGLVNTNRRHSTIDWPLVYRTLQALDERIAGDERRAQELRDIGQTAAMLLDEIYNVTVGSVDSGTEEYTRYLAGEGRALQAECDRLAMEMGVDDGDV